MKENKIFNDVNRYQQLLINFMSNAIKFTTNGIVQIKLSDEDQN